MKRRALIVGCGYTGTRLAERLMADGFHIVGTTRDEERAAGLRAVGIEPLMGELTEREMLRRIDGLGPHVVFYLVPPTARGRDPLSGVLEATSRSPLDSFVYASSTSVYGDRGGDWVDETSLVRPESDSARARHAAERAVVEASWSYQTPAQICRISGIYGPGRTLRSSLESGDYLLIRGYDTWVNRIHLEDLVSGLIAAWRSGTAGRVFNLVDDEPHRGSEFACLAADLHGLPRPRWVDEEEARRRYGGDRLRRKLQNKRVRSRRLREELGVVLKYPSYRTGLPAAIKEERRGGRRASSVRARPPSRR